MSEAFNIPCRTFLMLRMVGGGGRGGEGDARPNPGIHSHQLRNTIPIKASSPTALFLLCSSQTPGLSWQRQIQTVALVTIGPMLCVEL